MNKMKEQKSFDNTLYQELPSEILNSAAGSSKMPDNVKEFLVAAVPIYEAPYVDDDLRKTMITISVRNEASKKVKFRKRKTGLSQKERRAVGLYRLPKFSITYEESLPMNKLWESYMYRFLNLDHLYGKDWYNPKSGNLWDQMSVTLMKADYHGARLRVASSKCISMTGLEGIVIFDTKYTFTIVSKDDMSRTLPKQSCIFEVFLKKYKFKIFGKYFCLRTNERSTKKIKCSFIPGL